jgi:hypothetical protein
MRLRKRILYGDIASPIRWILRRQENLRVLLGEVDSRRWRANGRGARRHTGGNGEADAARRLPLDRYGSHRDHRRRGGTSLPGVVQVAMQQAAHAARGILRRIRGEPTTRFTYHDKGQYGDHRPRLGYYRSGLDAV